MALFVIEAVRLNADGDRVESVRWGKVKGGEVSPPVLDQTSIADVGEVIEALRAGDEVQTIFSDENGVSFGRNVEVIQDESGADSIAAVESEPSERGLMDLPRF